MRDGHLMTVRELLTELCTAKCPLDTKVVTVDSEFGGFDDVWWVELETESRPSTDGCRPIQVPVLVIG